MGRSDTALPTGPATATPAFESSMRPRSAVLALALLLAAAPVAAQLPKLPAGMGAAATSGMIGALSKQFGLTDKQSQGGLGSMLTLAKEQLPAAEFGKVAAAVPGASNYMNLAKSLGAVGTGPLTNMAGLVGALGKLGISPSVAAQFVPQAAKLMGTAGGPEIASILGKVFK